MRVLKEIDRNGMKITIFSWNGKLSVKCEKDQLEQIFKFRDGSGLNSLEDVEQLMDENFLETVEKCFAEMAFIRYDRCKKLNVSKGLVTDFDVII